MTLHYRDVASITISEIQQLCADKVTEGKDLEYKERLPGDTPDDKREFRFDVSSLANAGGGTILFGIREMRGPDGTTGIPEEIIPLNVNPDKETLRLEQILRADVDPRIPGVQIRFIQSKEGYVGIVRVPRSWVGLHLVKHNDSYRFYSRTSKGKYILDATEIRNGFVAAQEGYDRLTRFRYDRVAKIVANESSASMEEGPKAVLHVLPLSMSDPTIEFDLAPVQERLAFPPVRGSYGGWSNEHNYDGFMKSTRLSTQEATNYIQFFRTGAIEEVWSRFHKSDEKILYPVSIEGSCINSLTNCVSAVKRLGVVLPLLVSLSLLGVRGYGYKMNFWTTGEDEGERFRVSEFLLPPVLMTTLDEAPSAVLRSSFDRLWNAAGIQCSPFYNDQNEWKSGS